MFAAEDDVGKAVSAIEDLEKQACTMTPTAPTIPSPNTAPHVELNQLTLLENGLMECVTKLGDHKRIHGTHPTLEDLLNPVEEREISESEFRFPGGDAKIIAKVIREFQPRGDVEAENEGEESDREQEDTALSLGEGMELCERLEKLCVVHSEACGVSTLLLQQQLRKLRAHLCVVQANSVWQTSINSFFSSNLSPMDVDTM